MSTFRSYPIGASVNYKTLGDERRHHCFWRVMNAGIQMLNDASTLMTRDVHTVGPDESLMAVARVLVKNDISAVPVCSEAGELLGIVTEGDLIRPFAETNERRRAWWLSLLAEGTELAPDFLDFIRRENIHVRDLMTIPVVTATPSMTMPHLAELMTSRGIKRIPIVLGGRIVGIVSRSDLVRALSRMPASIEDRS